MDLVQIERVDFITHTALPTQDSHKARFEVEEGANLLSQLNQKEVENFHRARTPMVATDNILETEVLIRVPIAVLVSKTRHFPLCLISRNITTLQRLIIKVPNLFRRLILPSSHSISSQRIFKLPATRLSDPTPLAHERLTQCHYMTMGTIWSKT